MLFSISSFSAGRQLVQNGSQRQPCCDRSILPLQNAQIARKGKIFSVNAIALSG